MNKARALQGRNHIRRTALSLTLLAGVLAAGGCGSETSSSSSQLGSSTTVIPVADRAQSAKLSEQEHVLFLQLAATTEATPATYPFALTTTVANPGTYLTLYSEDPVRLPYTVNLHAPEPTPLPTPFVLTQAPFSVPAFNFVDSAPRFTAFEQFTLDPNTQVQPNLAVFNGGITLSLRNLQDGNSFTVGAGKPAGSNITYAFDNVYTSGGVPVRQTYLGTARFNNGWRAVFHSEDRLLGLPFGQQKSEVNLRFVPPQAGAVSVNDFVALPATFNPENNETTTFQAGVVATGFGNATLNWTLTPSGPPTTATVLARTTAAATGGGGGGAEIPPAFNGSADITSGVANVTQLWDGKSSTGQAMALGSYPYSLNVTVVDSTGLSQAATANTTVTLSTAPTLRVISGEGTPLAIAVPLANQDPVFLKQDNSFKKRVFPYRADQTTPWNITTWGIQFQLEPGQTAPEKLNVRLQSSVSLGNQTFQLDRQSEGSYSGTVPLTNALIKPDPENVTTYTTVTAIGSSSFDFVQLMKSSAATEVYHNPRNALGDFLGSMLDPDAAARDMLVPPTVENVRSGGFEAVKVSLLKSDNDNKLANDLTTVIYVRHPAKICYVNSHGSHTGVLNLADEYNVLRRGVTPPLSTVPPQDLTPGPDFSDPNVLDTLILNSCDSLDVYDYNNANLGREGRVLPTDPIALRPAPGLTWHQALVKDSGHYPALLGFNTPAAEFSQPGLIAFWGQELSATKNRVLAWMLANYKTGTGKGASIVPADVAFSSGFEDASLRAAALDDQFYYYIPCKYSKPEKGSILMPIPPTALGVYRVKLENAIPVRWDIFPPPVAEQVTDVNGTIIIP